MTWFCVVIRRKTRARWWNVLLGCVGLKVNAGKSKVMVLGWEEGLECEVCVDGIRLVSWYLNT